MSDAIHYDHGDPEARLGTLSVNLWNCDEDQRRTSYVLNDRAVTLNEGGWLHLTLSDEESISLYEQLRATWAGYLAERDERAGVPLATFLDGWKADTLAQYDGPDESFGAYALDDPKHPTFHDRYADATDNERG
jgi:hypothetical protein